MSRQLLNLPINIPWRQIAVSPDMMDTKFCNKKFPFPWRSSMAISVYEPKPEELPEELCGDRITFIKVTTSITGYQPTKEEIDKLDKTGGPSGAPFPDFPVEDFRDFRDRIAQDYFACYGVMLNAAVFPFPASKIVLFEGARIVFSEITKQDAPDDAPFLEVGTELPNPFEHKGVQFITDQALNKLVNFISLGNGTDAELDLHKKMVINLPTDQTIAKVEAKIAYLDNGGLKMEAFNTNGLVGTTSSDSAPNQVHKLTLEAQGIQKIVITPASDKASLLEFAYFALDKPKAVELKNFPHIIDFEPKRRDLYQAATEVGEVLTGSRSTLTTGKSLTHTESTENSIDFGAKATTVPTSTSPAAGEFSISTAQKNTETDQDQWSVQTDASRERRETQGTTTQLSQMYNLLTGYHAGTNRSVFLSLARPHVLQPTDRRTFVQGLRAIEGMQDYFLIVSRPKEIEGICIETSLETGHFPDNAQIDEVENEYFESFQDFECTGFADNSTFFENCERFLCVHTIDSGDKDWVIDQRASRKRQANTGEINGWDDLHPGIAELEDNSNDQANDTLDDYSYQAISETSFEVKGRICGARTQGPKARFRRSYRVFTRSSQPKKNHQESSAEIGSLFITSRKLCTCIKSGECIEVFPVPSPPPKEAPDTIDFIVDEPKIRINKALITQHARGQNRTPIAKEFLSQVKVALTRSSNSPSRHPLEDKVGFLESDYFKNQIKNRLPKEYLKTPLSKVPGLPSEVIKALGPYLTVNQALSIDLARFTRRTGLNAQEAAKVRHLLLGISVPTTNPSEDSKSTKK